MTIATLDIPITFGDCDPAGIVFYPNAFRWMDATFHHLLRPYGGHTSICDALQGVGLGLVDASAGFRSPMRDGDLLLIDAKITTWSRRSLTLTYTGRVDGAVSFMGQEVRCLFQRTETGMVAGDLEGLKQMLEQERV
ncbi:MAG: acyl-CoA thioesterase [Pseudomonadota bacterium]